MPVRLGFILSVNSSQALKNMRFKNCRELFFSIGEDFLSISQLTSMSPPREKRSRDTSLIEGVNVRPDDF
jgi:hypothetical protein